MSAQQYSERLAKVRALMHGPGLDSVVGPSADLTYLTERTCAQARGWRCSCCRRRGLPA